MKKIILQIDCDDKYCFGKYPNGEKFKCQFNQMMDIDSSYCSLFKKEMWDKPLRCNECKDAEITFDFIKELQGLCEKEEEIDFLNIIKEKYPEMLDELECFYQEMEEIYKREIMSLFKYYTLKNMVFKLVKTHKESNDNNQSIDEKIKIIEEFLNTMEVFDAGNIR